MQGMVRRIEKNSDRIRACLLFIDEICSKILTAPIMCSHSSFCMTCLLADGTMRRADGRGGRNKLSGFLMGQTAQRSGKKNDAACHPRLLHRWKWDRDVAREMPKQLHWIVNAWYAYILYSMEMVWKLIETPIMIRSSGFGLAWKLFAFSSSLCSYQLVLLGPGFQQLVLQFWKLSSEILTRKLVKSKNCRRNWNRASAKDLL